MGKFIDKFATRENRVEVIEWLTKNGHKYNNNAVAHAAFHGASTVRLLCRAPSEGGNVSKELLSDYAHRDRRLIGLVLSEGAARGGHLDILQQVVPSLLQFGRPNFSTCRTGDFTPCMTQAAENGHIRVLQWLYDNGIKPNEEATKAAASGGHIDVLQWLLEKGIKPDRETSLAAAGRGDLAILQWVLSNGGEQDPDMGKESAFGGHLAILRWLRTLRWRDDGWLTDVPEAAAFGGHLPILHWVTTECGCILSVRVCDYAAEQNHFDVIKWVVDTLKITRWTEKVSISFAERGQLKELQWCHERGCQIGKDTATAAAKAGHLEVLKWLQSVPCAWNATRMAMAAIDSGRLATTKWIFENVEYLRSHLCPAVAKKGDVQLFRRLCDDGCAVDKKSVYEALRYGHLHIAKLAHKTGCAWSTEEAADVVRRSRLDEELKNKMMDWIWSAQTLETDA